MLTLPATTETLERMLAAGCFQNNRLGYWPEWLDWQTVDDLAEAGLLTRTHYGPATYGHTEYTLSE